MQSGPGRAVRIAILLAGMGVLMAVLLLALNRAAFAVWMTATPEAERADWVAVFHGSLAVAGVALAGVAAVVVVLWRVLRRRGRDGSTGG